MKFILFAEGHTEKALPGFLKRWLDPQLSQPVRINVVRFNGWRNLVNDTPIKANLYLNGPDKEEIIGVIALLDLYGPTFYPKDKKTARERYDWAKKHLQDQVKHPKFRQFFAVHEIEAWLLSDPNSFPDQIRRALPEKIRHPEQVNFDEPPAALLERLYRQKTGLTYKKITNGRELFGKLDPNMAAEKCPRLKEFLNEMLKLAKEAGL